MPACNVPEVAGCGAGASTGATVSGSVGTGEGAGSDVIPGAVVTWSIGSECVQSGSGFAVDRFCATVVTAECACRTGFVWRTGGAVGVALGDSGAGGTGVGADGVGTAAGATGAGAGAGAARAIGTGAGFGRWVNFMIKAPPNAPT